MITGYALLLIFALAILLSFVLLDKELKSFAKVWLKGYLKALVFIIGVGLGAATLTLGVMMLAQELNLEWSARVFSGFDLREAAGEVVTELGLATVYLYTHYTVWRHYKKK